MSYSNYDVAHRWANGIGSKCNGSHMFSDGDCIYSYGYHFMIARKYKGVVLFNEERYSNSTTKHQAYVRGACWQKIVYCARLTGLTPGTPMFFDDNMKAWFDEIKSIVTGPLVKARKPEIYFNQISGIISRAERLCEVLGEKLPTKIAEYKADTSRDDIIQKMQAQAKREYEAAERKRKKVEKEAIKNFMEFKSYYCTTKYQIVRLNREKNRFETSLHVEVPFEKGREFYERLKNGTLKVGDTILFYTVREVGKLIRVGCHTFEKSYLLKYGKEVFA